MMSMHQRRERVLDLAVKRCRGELGPGEAFELDCHLAELGMTESQIDAMFNGEIPMFGTFEHARLELGAAAVTLLDAMITPFRKIFSRRP